MAAAALVVFALIVAAAAFVVFALSVAALVSFAVVMVVAVGACVDQVAAKVSLHCLIRISGSARAYLDAGIPERVKCAAAEAAADQDLDVVPGQKARQRAVSDSVGADHFARYYFAVFHLIYLKKLRSAEVLKNVSVLISSCNLHKISPFHIHLSLQ